jgi:hypothetical protein
MRRGGLDEEGGAGPDLAAQREALDQPAGNGQDRRRQADVSGRRDQRQHHHGRAHQAEGQQHRRLASRPVGEAAEHQSACGPHQEADAEGRQRRQQTGSGVGGGEEGASDLSGEEGVGQEVVELERVAGRHRRYLTGGNFC